MTPPPTLKQGSTHRSVLLPLPPSPRHPRPSLLSAFLSPASLPLSPCLPFSSYAAVATAATGASSRFRAAQIKFSSTVKQCRYPTRNNPHREYFPPPPVPRSPRSALPLSPPPPGLCRRASRIPLVSGRTDRTRIDRINYSLLTIIVQAGWKRESRDILGARRFSEN